ncbi:MAG: hypothetical protein ACI81R_001554 [Bradymonadia bacterium]
MERFARERAARRLLVYIAEVVTLEAEISGDDGGVHGHVNPFDLRPDRAPEGTLDANEVPIPWTREEPTASPDGLLGHPANLRIELTTLSSSTGVLELSVVPIEG